MIKVLKRLALLAVLSACGPLNESQIGAGFAASLSSRVSGAASEAPAPETASGGGLTRAQIDATPAALMVVTVVETRASDLVQAVGQNGSRITWINRDQRSLTFDRGLLVATRGLGFDLMGAEVAQVRAGLAGTGNHSRVMDFLDGFDQIQSVEFACTMTQRRSDTITIVEKSYATRVVQERCTAGDLSFANTYWVDANGIIWQSRQWVSPQVGYVDSSRL